VCVCVCQVRSTEITAEQREVCALVELTNILKSINQQVDQVAMRAMRALMQGRGTESSA
jgi:hypothetical protein